MDRCGVIWEDPAGGRGFTCGRKAGHRGDHAWQSDRGEWALWEQSGDLVMSVFLSES